MHLNDLLGGLGKCRYTWFAGTRSGVATRSSNLAVVGGGLACFCKPHQRIGTKAQVTTLAMNDDALHPAPGAAGLDEQKQTVEVVVLAPGWRV